MGAGNGQTGNAIVKLLIFETITGITAAIARELVETGQWPPDISAIQGVDTALKG
jgi:hypothetical protein